MLHHSSTLGWVSNWAPNAFCIIQRTKWRLERIDHIDIDRTYEYVLRPTHTHTHAPSEQRSSSASSRALCHSHKFAWARAKRREHQPYATRHVFFCLFDLCISGISLSLAIDSNSQNEIYYYYIIIFFFGARSISRMRSPNRLPAGQNWSADQVYACTPTFQKSSLFLSFLFHIYFLLVQNQTALQIHIYNYICISIDMTGLLLLLSFDVWFARRLD